MQESVGSIVLTSREPLGVFLYARFEEKGGMMLRLLDTDLCLDRVCVFLNDLAEVGFAEPPH